MFSDDCAAVVVSLNPAGMVLHDVAGVNVDRLHVAVGRHQAGVSRLAAVQAPVILEHHLNRSSEGRDGPEDDIFHFPIVFNHEIVAGTLVFKTRSLSTQWTSN